MMLTAIEKMALESFADTIIPGCKRGPDDRAIAGVSDDPGAVEAGALEVLLDPATGISDGVAEMARLLNRQAVAYAASVGLEVEADTAFADLDFRHRNQLAAQLTAAGSDLRDFWFLLALFSYMAYDSAPHMDTVDAMQSSHVGLTAMGFSSPDTDGVWRFDPASYGAALANVHPHTDERGNLP